MRLDLHNHTRYSPDSRVSPTDLVARARQLRLDGIAITDHNSVAGIREAALSKARFAAYETCNARTLRRGNERAHARAAARSVGQTGGSDSHFLDEVGRAVTVLEAGRLRAEDVVQWIGAGKTGSQGTD